MCIRDSNNAVWGTKTMLRKNDKTSPTVPFALDSASPQLAVLRLRQVSWGPRFSVSPMWVYDFRITRRDTARPDLATTLYEAPKSCCGKGDDKTSPMVPFALDSASPQLAVLRLRQISWGPHQPYKGLQDVQGWHGSGWLSWKVKRV